MKHKLGEARVMAMSEKKFLQRLNINGLARKPVFWLVIAGMIIMIVVRTGLLSNPMENEKILAEDPVSYTEELWKARTKYVGNNSGVGKIINLLQFPEGIFYDGFELHTREHPYAVTVRFKTDTEIRNFYSGADNQSPFLINALIMLSLIENAEYITFSLNDGIYDPYSIQYTADMAEMILGEEYYEKSQTLEGFNALLQRMQETLNTNDVEDNQVVYSIAKLGKNGVVFSYLSIDEKELAESIIMGYMLKSSAWKGVDIDTIEEDFLIRQRFPEENETHDFYAYLLDDGTAVLQAGNNGMYNILSYEFYSELQGLFE